MQDQQWNQLEIGNLQQYLGVARIFVFCWKVFKINFSWNKISLYCYHKLTELAVLKVKHSNMTKGELQAIKIPPDSNHPS